MKNILMTLSVLLLASCGKKVDTSALDKTPVDPAIAIAMEKTKSQENVKKIDSLKIKQLMPYFNVDKDEFSSDGKLWYAPKSKPKYINQNAIYCYFYNSNKELGALRFSVQYYADEWLFFDKIQFSIDEKAYEFIPSKTETDSGNGGYIWEWLDEPIVGTDKDLIKALANAKNAKMKFLGRQYYKVKTVTPKQIEDIKRVIELYNAMGGNF